MNTKPAHTLSRTLAEVENYRDCIERSLFAFQELQQMPSLRAELSAALAQDPDELIRACNVHADLLAALRPIAKACKEMLCQSDPGGSGLTLADCLDKDGEEDFPIRVTLEVANAIADAIAKAEGQP